MDQQPRRRLSGTLLRFLVGSLLVAAAILKTQALFANIENPHDSLRLPVYLVYGMVLVELTLGLWLVAEPIDSRSRITSILMFLIFSVVSLYQVFTGAKTCGCFGFLSVSPLLTFSLDVAILYSFYLCNPDRQDVLKSRLSRTATSLTLALTITLSVAFVFQGVRAHLDSAQFFSEDSKQGFADSRVHAQLRPNLPLVLSSLGVYSPDLEMPQKPPEGLADYLSFICSPKGISGVSAVSVPLATLIGVDSESNFNPPYITSTSSGVALVLLGLVRENDSLCYQLIEGARPPRLVPKHLLDKELVELWKFLRTIPGQAERRPYKITVPIGQSQLDVDRLYACLGSVKPNQKVETEFEFTNVGQSSITLRLGSISCSCLHATFPADVVSLAPNERVKLFASVDVGLTDIRQALTVIATDKSTNSTKSIKLQLLASQPQSLSVSTSDLNFGVVDGSSDVKRMIVLREVATDKFNIIGADVGTLPITWALKSTEQKSSLLRSYLVELTLRSGAAPAGRRNGVVNIRTSSKRVPNVPIKCSYEVPSLFKLQPEILSFGNLKSGIRERKIVKLTFAHDGECTVRPNSGPASNFTVSAVDQINAREFEIIVEFLGASPGPAQDSIELDAVIDGKVETVSVKCVGYVEMK